MDASKGAGEKSKRRPARAGRAQAKRPLALFVNSLAKGFRVLDAFEAKRPNLSLGEIAEASGLDKSAAQRFAYTLEALGYLRKDPESRRYSLSPKVLELGYRYLRADSLVARATPFLAEANKRCEETVNLTELDGSEVVYVARFPSWHAVSVDVVLGTRLPAFCTAPGRAMLAFLPEARARDIILHAERPALTERTVTDPDALMAELARVRRQGWSLADQETFVGDVSTAAPVLDITGQVVAAVNIAVPAARWSAARVRRELTPLVVETAAQISQVQGSRRDEAAGAHLG
ncbi:MAG TPA: IclR family transcriptional regulator C-terminal domain-containing protein [Alphaproteobacteria bacterium]|nr:IclR family transcriptional regulator C-terminal domain-containing protein [Alphaproteobacteria bacterium]